MTRQPGYDKLDDCGMICACNRKVMVPHLL